MGALTEMLILQTCYDCGELVEGDLQDYDDLVGKDVVAQTRQSQFGHVSDQGRNQG